MGGRDRLRRPSYLRARGGALHERGRYLAPVGHARQGRGSVWVRMPACRRVRGVERLARWGGDEFVLVLDDAAPFAATELVLQRLVRDLKESPVRLPQSQGGELALSVTVGASRYSGEDDLQDLLRKADEAMYEAKREGRPWILRR
jgi:predicted signal transduction protein with EAL and GGDEF domain